MAIKENPVLHVSASQHHAYIIIPCNPRSNIFGDFLECVTWSLGSQLSAIWILTHLAWPHSSAAGSVQHRALSMCSSQYPSKTFLGMALFCSSCWAAGHWEWEQRNRLPLIPLWESRRPTWGGGHNPDGAQRIWGLRRGGMEGAVTTWDRALGIWETGWSKMQCQWKDDTSHKQIGLISEIQNMNSFSWHISVF